MKTSRLVPWLALFLFGAGACSPDARRPKVDDPDPGMDGGTTTPVKRDGATASGPEAGTQRDAGGGVDARPDAPTTPTDTAPPPDTRPPAPKTNLAAPWRHVDVGDVALAGASDLTGGKYTVTGAGSDISGAADSFTFVHQAFTGDGEIVARVASVEQVDNRTKGGVMFRATTAAGALHATLVAMPARGSSFIARATEGVDSKSNDLGFAAPPRWVRLTRIGKTFTGYVSENGMEWFMLGSAQIDMPNEIQVGLVTSARTAALAAKAEFESVTIKKYPPYPAGLDGGATGVDGGPTGVDGGPAGADGGAGVDAAPGEALAAPWVTGDIGVVAKPGTTTVVGGVYTQVGSGADIQGMEDGFTYAFQPIAGDVEITARVVSVQALDPWTKGGVMIRAGLEPGAPNMFALGTGTNGVRAQVRKDPAGGTTDYAATFATPPAWVRVKRTGTSLSAFASRDGVTWAQTAQADLPTLGATAYVGLATTAHNATDVATVVFSDVTIRGGTPGTVDGGATGGAGADAGARD